MSIPAPLVIRAYRERAKLTQVEFAKMLGVTQGTIGHYESGRRLPAPETATTIEVVTKGAIKRAELRPDIFGPPS